MTTTEIDNDEVVLTYDESYYEERASAEEIYLEEMEEELRVTLHHSLCRPQDRTALIVGHAALRS